MLDIHSHILPFVDDGAEDFDEVLRMADLAVRSGVKMIVSTPHCNQQGRFENYESADLRELYEEVLHMLDAYDIPLRILRGSEIYVGDSRWIDKVESGRLISLNGTKNYLVEFPFDEYPQRMEEQLSRLLAIGKVPVIAHPERYYCVQDDPGIIRHFVAMGCLTQVNKGSVFDKFGRTAGATARYLLDANLVTCIGSDAHTSFVRTTQMRNIRDYLVRKYSFEKMRLLLEENPRKILGL